MKTNRKTAAIVEVDAYRDAGTGLTPDDQRGFVRRVAELVSAAVPRLAEEIVGHSRLGEICGIRIETVGTTIYVYTEPGINPHSGLSRAQSAIRERIVSGLAAALGRSMAYVSVR
jgi:hypothetical protein